MNYLYCDASVDHLTKLGTYCVVIVEPGQKPRWFVEDCDNLSSSMTETRAILRAVREAQALYERTGRLSVVFSDSMSSIKSVGKTLSQTPYVSLRHIKAHTIGQTGIVLTEDIKRNNWADKEARRILRKRIKALDKVNTSEHTDTVKETTK